ncbi:hypothetical protein EPH95_06830 [Salicibibacter halophilus]|uniref:Tubby C-terminal domain-containing protein n=1 Tax=Salicibibacter halophilus TaxID=2502791 RepID=A0A514LGF0_9BACI|nr:hypothetical protein [Salicibibacter halophilus]QDI90928.1 hypothetical protein EPH95_06830 [Salicibibacter halophilus]
MNVARILALAVLFIAFIIVEPILANVQDRELMDSYPALFGAVIVLLFVLVIWRIYTLRSRKKAQENFKNEINVGEDINQLGEDQYAYQEPLQQFDQHPVRIFNKDGEPTAVFEVRFRNKYEKFMTVTGFMDYSNILMKTQDGNEEIYLQTVPVRESLRQKWKVFLNGKEHATLKMEPGYKTLKRGLEFKCYYENGGEMYILNTMRFGTKTTLYLKGEENNPVLHCERSFIGMGKKGKDESRGRKHHLHDVKNSELSLIEKAGVYQQIISRIKR